MSLSSRNEYVKNNMTDTINLPRNINLKKKTIDKQNSNSFLEIPIKRNVRNLNRSNDLNDKIFTYKSKSKNYNVLESTGIMKDLFSTQSGEMIAELAKISKNKFHLKSKSLACLNNISTLSGQ